METLQITPARPAAPAAEIEKALLQIVKGLDVSESTRSKYSRHAGRVSEAISGFISSNVPPALWLVEYKRALLNSYSAPTAAVYLAAAKAMITGLERAGLITEIAPVKGVKVSKGHKRTGVTRNEMERVNDVIAQCDVRVKAMFALLALQGLRQCEIIRLDVTDVDLKDGVIRITGKGCDDYELMPLHPKTRAALCDYLQTHVTEGPLFVAMDNRSKAAPKRLSVRGLNKIMKSVFGAANVDRTVHGLRHLFVTSILEALDGNVVQTQRWSRHKSLEMLQVYNDERNHSKTQTRVFRALDALL